MPWSGLEPLRLSAPPPQDGVSTNFTTRAQHLLRTADLTIEHTGPTGLEPATSRVTVECSNQTELRPLTTDAPPISRATSHNHSPKGNRTPLCTVKGCRPNR